MIRPRENGNCLKGVLIGCLVLFLVVAGLIGGTLYYAWQNPEMTAWRIFLFQLEVGLDFSGLTEEQKEGIRSEFDRVTKAIERGEFKTENFTRILESFQIQEAMALFLLEALQTEWIEQTDLSEQEREEKIEIVQAVQKGIVEEKFSQEEIGFIIKAFPTQEGTDGQQRVVDEMSPEEVEKMFDDLSQIIEKVGIEPQKYQVDYVKYVEKLVDEILKKGGAEVENATGAVTVESATGSETVQSATPTD